MKQHEQQTNECVHPSVLPTVALLRQHCRLVIKSDLFTLPFAILSSPFPSPSCAVLCMSAPSPSDLSARLDVLLVDFFAIFADIRSLRSELSSLLSDGYYELSLAQHDSPHLPLDQSSYAGRDMTATTTIIHSATEPPLFSIHQLPTAAPSSSVSVSASSPIRPGVFSAHMSARDRKLDALIAQRGQLDDATEQRIEQSVAAADIAASAPPPVPDLPSSPLMWFGVLAPKQLTTAQTAFSRAMERVAQLCQLHLQLRAIEQQWMALLEQKDEHLAQRRKQAAQTWKDISERSGDKEEEDEEEAGGMSGQSRRELEESKEQGESGSSRKVSRHQSSKVKREDTDKAVEDAMQSLTITKHRKKVS